MYLASIEVQGSSNSQAALLPPMVGADTPRLYSIEREPVNGPMLGQGFGRRISSWVTQLTPQTRVQHAVSQASASCRLPRACPDGGS